MEKEIFLHRQLFNAAGVAAARGKVVRTGALLDGCQRGVGIAYFRGLPP